MEIHIQFLRQAFRSRQVLRAKGWRLDEENDEVRAVHPQIEDENAAREALWRLGLLTSPCVRIRFDHGPRTGTPWTTTRPAPLDG